MHSNTRTRTRTTTHAHTLVCDLRFLTLRAQPNDPPPLDQIDQIPSNPRESVVLIPFIDEDLMVSALSEVDHRNALSQEERARNLLGREQTFWPVKRSVFGICAFTK